MSARFVDIARHLSEAGVSYAVIGAHAVNVWLEPRFTADIDLTVHAGPEALQRIEDVLHRAGLTRTLAHGSELPSGPDFVRFASDDGNLVLELQAAKTDLQREVLRRAVTADGVSVATPEDLIILKLIADRPKDRVDLLGLVALPELDWSYVEAWAAAWDIGDRLARLRTG